jgi:hypothetical protein
MIVKKNITPDNRMLLAVVDDELAGKTIKNKKKQLDLSSEFYKGIKMTKEELLPLLKQAYIMNFVGKESVNLAVENFQVQKEHILYINRIPHAQVLQILDD